VNEAYLRAAKRNPVTTSVVRAGQVPIGTGDPALIAVPGCQELAAEIAGVARALVAAGIELVFAGMLTDRPLPSSCRRIPTTSLQPVVDTLSTAGLSLIFEILEPALVDTASAVAAVLQIGSDHMADSALLKAVGRVSMPVLLKRGPLATLDEWLLAAEYILAEGNQQVILCESGIRGFAPGGHHFLDLTSVPLMQTMTHLPVIVSTCDVGARHDLIEPMACAAIALGAYGVMVDVCLHAGVAPGGTAAIMCAALPGLRARLRSVRAAVQWGTGNQATKPEERGW
jgi:3-deoxy-7-phosphoheptulonate synthase